MKPHELRLAADLLREHADKLGNNGCNDWKWPDWFPIEERSAFVHDAEMWNSGDPNEAAEAAEEMDGEYGPADFFVAAYLAHLLFPEVKDG